MGWTRATERGGKRVLFIQEGEGGDESKTMMRVSAQQPVEAHEELDAATFQQLFTLAEMQEKLTADLQQLDANANGGGGGN